MTSCCALPRSHSMATGRRAVCRLRTSRGSSGSVQPVGDDLCGPSVAAADVANQLFEGPARAGRHRRGRVGCPHQFAERVVLVESAAREVHVRNLPRCARCRASTGNDDQPRSTRVSRRRAGAGQPRVGVAVEERPQAHLALRRGPARHPGRSACRWRRTGACPALSRLDVEAVRVVEDVGVAVGTGQMQHDQSPRRIVVPATSTSRRATRAVICTGESSRRISSTALGHSSGRAAACQDARVVEQHADAVAQQVDRGFEPGGQHQARGGLQLSVVKPAPSSEACDELAQQIVARVAPQLAAGGPPSQALKPDDALLDLPVLPPGQPDVQARRTQLTEMQDAGAVLVGNPEDVADHGDRKLRTVALDDVDGAVAAPRVSSSRTLAVCSTRSRSARPPAW